MIHDLIGEHDHNMKKQLIEEICALLVEKLRQEGLTGSRSDFLLDHAHSIHCRIRDKTISERFSIVP